MAPPDIALNGHTSPRLSRSRSHSISSDRPSASGYSNLLSPPVSTSPEPAFIAASAASQIVTNDHDSRSDIWLDQHGIEPSGETALVAPAALKLVNRFLDQLLFNFLSISRSTSLASLRPAVSEVLKPKLAKDAISGADQELQEYLGGGEDEELLAFHNGAEPNGDWDLELVWKRTRLRCMVYSSLGDMEEEDEDYYTEQEQLDGPPGSNNRFSNNPGVVSPAVAIFLTSILEFMGEQALIIAGQAAYFRLRAKIEKEERDGLSTPASIAERVVVDESDMERVALDRTLGRLWRGWKKRVRSPTASVSMSRSFSRESLNSMIHGASRSGSIAPQEDRIEEDSPEEILTEDAHAATIPLPISKDDVREIEIPGLALQSDDEDEQDSNEEIKLPTRPKSMMVFTQMATKLPTPNSSQPDTPQTPGFLSSRSRKRSNSMPTPAGTPYSSPSSKRANLASGDGLVTTADPAKPTAEDAGEPKGFVAGVAAGAVAIGAAAVAGITAAANGEAPQTELVNKDETDPELLYEEPQVMTISSFSTDESISPIVKDSSRRSSMRSHSIHSLRVIDVASPRSASPRSPMTRQSSTDDYVSSGARVVSLSRPASLHSPIIVDASTPRGTSPILRSQTASPVVRNGSALSSRQARNSAEESISEAEEKDVIESPVTAVPAEIAAAMQGVSPGPEFQHFQSGSTAKVAEKPLPFILGAPPPPRNAAREAAKTADNRVTQSNNATSSTPRAFVPETAAPPLTPLREMVEGAPDTSDESSSITPSQKTRSSSEAAMSNQDSEQTPKARAPTSTSRNSPPRSTAKAQRSLHTSRSSSSSISKVKPTRTSEDSSRTEHGQSFEELIRSDQTIQYTLTPENMRNIEGDSPPANGPKAQNVRPPTGRSHSSSIGKHTGLHSNPPADSGKSSKPVPKSIPTPPSNTGSRRRPGAPQARDAKIDRDSIGDFAEFIRSTGPPGSFNDVSSRPPVAINGHRGANGIPKLASGSAPRVTPVSTLPRRAESSAGRNRLQARDAVVPNGDTSSDLIDFIRQGPPSTNFDDHRIPRTVAPFRTTMDSDQMAGAVGGKAIDASLPDPRYSQTSISNDQSMQSKTSSINSQSALLNNSSSKTKKPPTSYSSKNDFDEEDMMPKRKTRRVRDPYAIDFSDEEDEFEVAASRKPAPIKEESLADFLRNVPPPPDNDPPVLASLPQKDIRKKASAPSLMSRFGRKETTPPLPPKPQSSKGYESRSAPSRNGNGALPLPTHTPLNVKPSASSPPLRGNADYVSQLDTARNPPTGRVVQKSYQPREPSINRTTRTSDLADFLRSDPPPGMTGPSRIQTTPVHQREESSGFSRMFGRRRKHSVAT